MTPAPAPGATGVRVIVVIGLMSMFLATASVAAPVGGALLMLLVLARSVAVTVPAIGNNLRPRNQRYQRLQTLYVILNRYTLF